MFTICGKGVGESFEDDDGNFREKHYNAQENTKEERTTC